MKPIFKSPDMQRSFDRDGFVKVALLSKAEAEELSHQYQTTAKEHEQIGIPYITTSHSNNPDLIARVDNIIQGALIPKLDEVLQNYKLLFSNFLVKMPIDQSDTPPHQDITFVDEEHYYSISAWVALQDVDKNNGCMYFLPGSHKFMPTIRPTHSYPWPYATVKEEIFKKVVSFPVKAGEGFIFMHSVIHGSFGNHSGKPRVAAILAAYSDEAQLLHYFLPKSDPKEEVQEYKMTKEAFIHFVKEQPPAKGEFIRKFRHDFRQIDNKEFASFLRKDSAKRYFPFLNSIGQWLNA